MELIFRILLLTLFIGFIAHRGYYTRKMGRPAEDTVKARDEKSTPLIANLLSLPAFLGTILYIFYPKWMAWASLPLPAWLRWAGVGLALLGFLLLQWAQQALGRNWSDIPRLLKEHSLVTSGPYRWVRHPLYTAFLLIMSATLFISANWFIGLTWIAMTFLEVMSRINSEEGMMLEQFGEAYRVYSQGTGRLFPRPTRAEKDKA